MVSLTTMCLTSAANPSVMQFTLYSSVESQWVGVPHLALLEKGYNKDEYEVKEISLSKYTKACKFVIYMAG